MNPTDIALACVAVLALLAISWWLRARSRAMRDPDGEAKRRLSAERFDTTMGELRDLREALRPVQQSHSKGPRGAAGPNAAGPATGAAADEKRPS
ncbi:MAG: hypothetical protein ACJ8G7_16135 [Rhizobacter sp.]